MKARGVRMETRRAQKIRRHLTSKAEALEEEWEEFSTYPTDSNLDDCPAHLLSTSTTTDRSHQS
jgi:hypothetical protein